MTGHPTPPASDWDLMPTSCTCSLLRHPPCTWCEQGDEPMARLPLSAWRTLMTIGADR